MHAFHIAGARIVDYRAVIEREFPEWKATLTGGGIPEPGQAFTSMSYARLLGDVHDWLEWNEWGELNGWVRDPVLDEDEDAEAISEDAYECVQEVSGDGGQGEGWSLEYDCRWPKEVNDALKRYWAAKKTIDETSATIDETSAALGEPLCTIHIELQAGDADVAAMVYLPVERTEQIMMAYRQIQHFRQDGRTMEDWRAWREQIEQHDDES